MTQNTTTKQKKPKQFGERYLRNKYKNLFSAFYFMQGMVPKLAFYAVVKPKDRAILDNFLIQMERAKTIRKVEQSIQCSSGLNFAGINAF